MIEVISTGGALGAEVRGLDLSRELDLGLAESLRQALLEHCVLLFRDQSLSEQEQVRFTGYFGAPTEHVRKQGDRAVKEIFVISNVSESGKPIGALGSHELPFHSDLSYMPRPGTISVLYAVEVPSHGGRTSWCNGYAALDALDPFTRRRLDGARAIHRHPEEEQNPLEPADHPVVRTHPETGRRSLYVSPEFTRRILGLEEEVSTDLLGLLFAHLARPEFIWTHDWRPGDVVMWDNRPTLHRREPFPSEERRVMKRTQVFGDEIPV